MKTKLPDISVIYQIRNISNNKIYIGSAVNARVRRNRHVSDLRKGIHHSIILQRAWVKYGEENFIFEILEEVPDKNKLLEREQYYLDEFKSFIPNIGYNVELNAASSLGVKRSDWFKERLRAANLGKIRPKETVESNRKAQTGLHKGENNSAARTFTFKSPDGIEHIVKGRFYAFCKEQKLSKYCMQLVCKGERSEYQGWTLVSASPSTYSRNL